MNKVEEIKKAINRANNILVGTHVAPDGDAIGSLTAVGLALKQLGKTVTIACDDPSPDKFSYLAMVDDIQHQIDDQATYDLLIAVDCGDETRLGKIYTRLGEKRPPIPILNIDHHITNNNFGTINLVDGDSTAACEILTDLFPKLGVTIDQPIATSLLTGLVTDTLAFRISSVTGHTLKAASLLVEAGANLGEITNRALVLKSFATVQLWRLGLNKIGFEDGVMWTTITDAERRRLGYGESSSQGLGNFLADVYEAAMSAVLMELKENKIVCSFRSRPPFDVAELAISLGGGGHKYAAGCTVRGSLEEVEQMVIAKAKIHIATQVEAGVRAD